MTQEEKRQRLREKRHRARELREIARGPIDLPFLGSDAPAFAVLLIGLGVVGQHRRHPGGNEYQLAGSRGYRPIRTIEPYSC